MTSVLVVDDSAVDRKLTGTLLAKHIGSEPLFASNGQEALDLMEKGLPDLVLTDMQMPEMSGLELVEAIRRKYPSVPVILITAHGSEELAVQALQRGAASYVPKKNLARDLGETVDNVLSAARATTTQQRLLECLTRTESYFLLENDPSLVAPLIGHLQDNVTRMKLCDGIGKLQVTVALQEALINAIYHGNLEVGSDLKEQDEKAYYALVQERRQQEPYRSRRTHVIARETLEQAVYTIRDEGPGFDPSQLPDPTDPENLAKASGRGLLLIRTFMDDVRFNEWGNEITLIKRRDAAVTAN